jgi:hypothetical protein
MTVIRRDQAVQKETPSPKYADPDWQRLCEEFLRDGPQAIRRLDAHLLFSVSLWEGVDTVASRAQHLFDAIPPEVLAAPDGASGREIFRHSLKIVSWIVMLARCFGGGNKDIEIMANALMSGLNAVIERDRGFDEPFLRARQRLSSQSRESLYVRRVKAIAAEACEALIQFGTKDAAGKVAAVINDNQFLPLRTNGSGVVPRTVLNWLSRLRSGDLKKRWMHEREAALFPNAHRLFREGRPEAARRRVIRFLPRYIEEERRAVMGEISPPPSFLRSELRLASDRFDSGHSISRRHEA